MTRLGLHSNTGAKNDMAIDYCRRVQPAVMKWLEPNADVIAECRQASPSTLHVGRMYFPSEADKTLSRYGEFQDRVLSWAPGKGLDYVEGYNEWGDHDTTDEAWHEFARLEVGLAKRLNDAGLGAAIGGFSTGFLDESKKLRVFDRAWRYMQEVGWRACAYHSHEYSGPYMQYMVRTPDGLNQWDHERGEFKGSSSAGIHLPSVDGWLTLRYRQLVPLLRAAGYDGVRMIVSEGGIDDVQPRPGPRGNGWRDYHGTEWARLPGIGDYVEQLAWYMRQLSRDDFIIGAVDFGFGTMDPTWDKFDLSQDPAVLERVISSQQALPIGLATVPGAPPAVPPISTLPPTPIPTPTPTPGDGLYRLTNDKGALVFSPVTQSIPANPVPAPRPPAPPPPVPSGHGIDVSHWQGKMDWSKSARAGVRFAWCKATEGTSFTDPRWDENARGAHAADILVGGYHYFHNDIDPRAQARHFAKALANRKLTLPPAGDFEDAKSPANVEGMRIFLEEVQRLTGQRPVIYTGTWWWNPGRLGGAVPWARKYPLWVAQYRDGAPQIPSDWDDYAIHQYTSEGDGPALGAASLFIDRNRVGRWPEAIEPTVWGGTAAMERERQEAATALNIARRSNVAGSINAEDVGLLFARAREMINNWTGPTTGQRTMLTAALYVAAGVAVKLAINDDSVPTEWLPFLKILIDVGSSIVTNMDAGTVANGLIATGGIFGGLRAVTTKEWRPPAVASTLKQLASPKAAGPKG